MAFWHKKTQEPHHFAYIYIRAGEGQEHFIDLSELDYDELLSVQEFAQDILELRFI